MVDFRDFALSDSSTKTVRERVRSAEPLRISLIPWPDGEKTRTFGIPAPADEIVLRVVGGRVIQKIEESLGPDVFSNRMKSGPPAWTVHSRKRAHRKKTQRIKELARRADFSGALVTDVRDYFGSISVPVAQDRLSDLGVDNASISTISTWIGVWNTRDQLRGIPIVPDISGLVGNTVLTPIDHCLKRKGFSVIRFSDDYVIFDVESKVVDDLIDQIDEELANLSLSRSAPKTHYFDNADELLGYISNSTINYYSQGGGVISQKEARRLFDTCVNDLPVDKNLFKWLITVLANLADPYAMELLTFRTDLWQIDPARCGRYVAAILSTQSASGAELDLLPLVSMPPKARTIAIKLSILRAFRSRTWDEEQGQVFEEVMVSKAEHELVRAEAAMAWSHTTCWDPSAAHEIALSPGPLPLRRAATAAFGRFLAEDGAEQALSSIASADPELAPTAEWAGLPKGA